MRPGFRHVLRLVVPTLGVLVAAGCGVRASSDAAAKGRDCPEITKLAGVQAEIRRVDQGIQDDRPAKVTVASLAPLAKHYRAAVQSYRRLERGSRDELARLRRAQPPAQDLVKSWSMMAASTKLKGDGMAFIAEAFQNPGSIPRSAYQLRVAQMRNQQDRLNLRLKKQLDRTLIARGFARRDDGQFLLTC